VTQSGGGESDRVRGGEREPSNESLGLRAESGRIGA